MEILNLTLSNFRNFTHKSFDFDKKLTIIVGENGVGKSNMLEAISLLSAVRSSRVETDLDLVSFGSSDAKIEGRVQNEDEISDLVLNIQVVDERLIRKSYFINLLKKRLLDFVPLLAVVEFRPQDLDLISGSPSLRRREIDVRLSSVDREYWRNLSSYNKVVVRRNRVLWRISEGTSKPLELNFWDERLCEHGNYISKKRVEFFDFLNFIEPTFAQVSSGRRGYLKGLSWQLKQSVVSADKLLKNRERDIAAGVTLSGPHRDDFRFLYKDRDLDYFGSRGQQRLAVLALKLSELEYFRSIRDVRPILALDDIFSELDWEHRETVMSVVGSQQTIITAAEVESIPKEIFKKAKIVEI